MKIARKIAATVAALALGVGIVGAAAHKAPQRDTSWPGAVSSID